MQTRAAFWGFPLPTRNSQLRMHLLGPFQFPAQKAPLLDSDFGDPRSREETPPGAPESCVSMDCWTRAGGKLASAPCRRRRRLSRTPWEGTGTPDCLRAWGAFVPCSLASSALGGIWKL